MTNPTLKNCPFCDGKCWVNKDAYKPGTGYVYSIHCSTCHYSFNGHDFVTEESVIQAWNSRPTPQLTGSREKLINIISINFPNTVCQPAVLADAIISSMPDWVEK